MVSKVMSTLVLGILPCLAQSNLLQITSPASGTIVNPGQVVTVLVNADPSVSNVAVTGEDPLGFSGTTNGQPLQFQLTIPSNTTPGPYDVSAIGTASDGSLAASPAISLQVDPPTTHVNLRTEPSVLRFSAPGETIPLHVIGTLPDGSEVDMTHASKMDYLFGSPQIATVDSQGIVTATGYGSTYITVGPSDWGPYSVYVHTTVGELATMTSPGRGTDFCSSSVTFQWNGSSVAMAYRIDVGSDWGLHNIYQSGDLPTTTLSQTLTGLLEGPLFVTLWTEIDGQWVNNQYQYHVSCPPDFTLSAAPSSLTVRTGQQGTSTITAATSGLFWACDDPIRFSASGVPWPTTDSFTPSAIPGGTGSSTLTLNVDRSTPVGTYPITVVGLGGWMQHTTPITVTVVKH